MPSGGSRSRNGSWRGGSTRCTASTTLSYCCAPVTASTCGYRDVIFSGSAPMQPVTITLPLLASALPIAASDSACALSRKPQVLTTARSAPACERASSYPSARRRVMMRSLSTSAFGQPSETKLTRGARGEGCRFSMARGYPSAPSGASGLVERAGSGPSSLNFHHCGLYRGCSRPSFRPRMYRRERGRDRCRPAGRNPWRVFILEGWVQRGPPRSCWERPPRTSSLTRESRSSWYLHTAAREPHGPLARLNRDAAALAARGGNDADLEILLGGRGGAHA